MKLSTLPPFRKTTIILMLSIAGLLLAIVVYIYVFLLVKNSTEKTVALQNDVSQLQAQEREADTLKKNVANTLEQQKILSSYFIDMNNPVPFFETIEGYGTSVGAKAVFKNVELKKDPNELDASVYVTGSFSSIYQFMALLEASPYEFSIKNIDFQSSVPIGLEPVGKGPHTSGWEAQIQLAVVSITGTK